VVIGVIKNGPAARAGVFSGEVIKAIDGKPMLKGTSLKEAVTLIRGTGEIGSEVLLALFDPSSQKTFEPLVRREVIEIECLLEGSISVDFMSNGNFGSLQGFVGPDFINWNVNSGWVTGWVKNESVNLRIDQWANQLRVSGYLRGSYLEWYSSGTHFYGFQNCIP
jgi:membrane-associated protease RseP (regulator of RpoE activity)